MSIDIGSELRQAREQRGLSLRELSQRTKIRLSALRAIESNDFAQLPGEVFVRGFLKLYAREVGLDPTEVVDRYTAQKESGEPGGPAEREAAVEHAGTRLAAIRVAMTRLPRPVMVGIVVVSLALLAIGYFALRPSGGRAAPTEAGSEPPGDVIASTAAPTSQAPAERSVGAATPPGTVPAVSTAPAARVESPANEVRLDLRATGPVWISATADGKQVAYRLLSAGENVSIRATTEAVLRIGMPANVTLSINDRPVRPFERPGSPVTLRVTPENYRSLITQPGAPPPP
jgi:cytoskeletal protein RodZ